MQGGLSAREKMVNSNIWIGKYNRDLNIGASDGTASSSRSFYMKASI
jgi:hypothetical protein